MDKVINEKLSYQNIRQEIPGFSDDKTILEMLRGFAETLLQYPRARDILDLIEVLPDAMHQVLCYTSTHLSLAHRSSVETPIPTLPSSLLILEDT